MQDVGRFNVKTWEKLCKRAEFFLKPPGVRTNTPTPEAPKDPLWRVNLGVQKKMKKPLSDPTRPKPLGGGAGHQTEKIFEPTNEMEVGCQMDNMEK